MNSFNIHFQAFQPGECAPGWHKRRGFTAVVERTEDPKRVRLYFSFCSKKDEFNKRKGVETALAHGSINIAPKALPKALEGLAHQCYKHPLKRYNGSFDYVLKRFV